jgi:hypothetical protein
LIVRMRLSFFARRQPGARWLKTPSSMGKVSPPRSFDSAPQALSHAINL